jgi:hypothetical protein
MYFLKACIAFHQTLLRKSGVGWLLALACWVAQPWEGAAAQPNVIVIMAHLEEDPGETRNRARGNPVILAELKALVLSAACREGRGKEEALQ